MKHLLVGNKQELIAAQLRCVDYLQAFGIEGTHPMISELPDMLSRAAPPAKGKKARPK